MSGFLTRLLTVNAVSCNVSNIRDFSEVIDARSLNVEEGWKCDICGEDDFDDYREAYECCPVHQARLRVMYLELDALMVNWSYLCPACHDEHVTQDAAQKCCPRHMSVTEQFECPDCFEAHGDEEEAALCCAPSEGIFVRGLAPQCMVCMREIDGSEVSEKSNPLSWWVAAAQCCLPVKSDVLNTVDCLDVALLVVQGVPWVDAVAQVEEKVKAHRAEVVCH